MAGIMGFSVNAEDNSQVVMILQVSFILNMKGIIDKGYLDQSNAACFFSA